MLAGFLRRIATIAEISLASFNLQKSALKQMKEPAYLELIFDVSIHSGDMSNLNFRLDEDFERCFQFFKEAEKGIPNRQPQELEIYPQGSLSSYLILPMVFGFSAWGPH